MIQETDRRLTGKALREVGRTRASTEEDKMDPADNATRWNRWSASGSQSVVSSFFSILGSHLPVGWKQLAGDELLPYLSMVKQGSGWYAIETTSTSVGVTLSIERPRESELRGGYVWFAGPPYNSGKPSVPAAWEQVGRFLDDGVIPAAMAAGAHIRVPTVEDVFLYDLPMDVRDRLRMFSDTACKSLPLDREKAELWREFVVAAFRTKAIIDAQPFIDWLSSEGWSRDAAAELHARFLDQCLLLSQYADEVSVA